MAEQVDVAVIGGGLMGAAAAWAAARRGLSVALHEQFEPGHTRGSSHGSARIVRRGYGDALYTRLTGEAFELWREVEIAAAVRLLRMVGGLDHGPNRTARVASLLAEAGISHEIVAAADAEARWPGMHFTGPVVYPVATNRQSPYCTSLYVSDGTTWNPVAPYTCSAKTYPFKKS